jgi:HD-like signal output (HDOD) protein
MKDDPLVDVLQQAQKVKTEIYFNSYPALAVTSFRVEEICTSTGVKPQDIFAIINADPMLTGIVYALYHEFFPGNKEEFFGIARIITELGVNTVKNSVLNAVKNTVDADKKNLKEQTEFLRRSLSTGIISLLLAKQRGINEAHLQKYYSAGLMHDIGSFILSEDNGTVFNSAREGITPAKAGLFAAKLWGFPPVLRDVIAFHRDYRDYSGNYTDVVLNTALAASFLNKATVKTTATSGAPALSGTYEAAQNDILRRLNLPQTIFEEINTPFKAELKKIETFIGMEAA